MEPVSVFTIDTITIPRYHKICFNSQIHIMNLVDQRQNCNRLNILFLFLIDFLEISVVVMRKVNGLKQPVIQEEKRLNRTEENINDMKMRLKAINKEIKDSKTNSVTALRILKNIELGKDLVSFDVSNWSVILLHIDAGMTVRLRSQLCNHVILEFNPIESHLKQVLSTVTFVRNCILL